MDSEAKFWLSFWLSRIKGEMEIRPLGRDGKAVISFWASSDPEKIIKYVDQNARNHVYFGVLGRNGSTGGKESIQEAHCLWADIDFKELHDGQVEADGILATFELPPSLVILSGGGYHAYWLLKESTTDLERVERVLKGLVPRLKSDPKVAQAACILRVPGTKNWKYDPPREVKIISSVLEREYTLDDFKEWELPEEKPKEKPALEGEERIDLKQYLKHYKVPFVKVKKHGSSLLYCLKECLFEEGHTTNQGADNQAAIGQTEQGLLFYQCFHASCADKTWADVRQKISAGDPLSQFVGRDVAVLIEKYISQATGQFSLGGMTGWLDIKTMQERQATVVVLEEMEKKRVIVRCSDKHGIYRPVDKDPHIMALGGAKREKLKIELPLSLHTLVHLYPRNVILCAGEKDAGKTAFAMNAAYMNRDRIAVKYFNSEMGADELEARLLLFPDARISEWKKITWIERASRFEDFIDPNGFNIIDFLEVGADAYAVVDDIKRVFDRLMNGLLLIVMQKRSYKEWAVGGEGTLEKARLAVNLQYRPGVGNICKITVAKNWTGAVLHPRGRECEYKIWNGGKMEMTGTRGWYDPDAEEAIAPKKKKLNIVTKKGTDSMFPHEE